MGPVIRRRSDTVTAAVAGRRGDVWMVDFSSPIGAEAAFERPAVIVSNNAASESGLPRDLKAQA